MKPMKARLRSGAGRIARLGSGRELDALRQRVAVLEDEVQECRQLNLRLAELTDVVQELLLPVAQRDEAKLAEVLGEFERYSKGL
jgi:hypothetical protein